MPPARCVEALQGCFPQVKVSVDSDSRGKRTHPPGGRMRTAPGSGASSQPRGQEENTNKSHYGTFNKHLPGAPANWPSNKNKKSPGTVPGERSPEERTLNVTWGPGWAPGTGEGHLNKLWASADSNVSCRSMTCACDVHRRGSGCGAQGNSLASSQFSGSLKRPLKRKSIF